MILLRFRSFIWRDYEFSQPVSGAWVDEKCEADSAEECVFTVVKNHW